MTVPVRNMAVEVGPDNIMKSGRPFGTDPIAWNTSTFPTQLGPYVIGNPVSVDWKAYLVGTDPGATYTFRQTNGTEYVLTNGLIQNSNGMFGTAALTGSATTITGKVRASYLGVDVDSPIVTIPIIAAPTDPITVDFPRQTLNYLSITPYSGGKAMNSPSGFGRHVNNPVPNATRLYYIDRYGNDANNGSYDNATRVGAGSAAFCMRHATPAGQPDSKVIIPLIAGWIDIPTNFAGRHDNMILCGQFAPGQGMYLRKGLTSIRGLNHAVLWHVPLYVGDDMTVGPSANGRDGFQFGALSHTAALPVAQHFLNCEVFWAMDETLEAFYALSHAHWQDCAFGEPLAFSYHLTDSTSVPEQHGAGPLVGGSGDHVRQANFMSVLRCFFPDSSIRNPKIYGKNVSIGNCLLYNHGKASTSDTTYNGVFNTGGGIDIASVDDVDKLSLVDPVLWNVMNNAFVRGIHNNDTSRLVGGNDKYKDGSKLYCAGNAQKGWTPFTSQDQFWNGQGPYPPGWKQTSPVTDALPGGWLDGLKTIAADPLNPTTAELVDFVTSIGKRCGSRPGLRVNGVGRMKPLIDDVLASVQGLTPSGGVKNSVGGTLNPTAWNTGSRPVGPNAGGWFAVANASVTAASYGIPSVAEGRDTPQVGGTLADGVTSADGRTKLEIWCLNRHYVAMGNQW